MAVSNEDLARLIVTLEATTTRYSNELRKAQQQTNNTATGIERRLTSMSTRIDKTFANLGNRLASNITGPLAGVGAALSTREIIRYADAWTEATNSIAASSDITGIQGRSLQDLRTLADESRAGFEETVKLYTRIQRSAGAVANSEEELARATSIVNKAFKAGGAASSEMAAGILQLSQGLGSGYLQGDELRSVRENAPVLAKVIADYFGVTIAGLKELGSEGKLTSDLVFKAILSGEAQIASAFSKTNATISDGFTRVRNALIEYIGSADQSSGVTVALTAGLNALADNIGNVADGVLKLASIIAGALVGRSLVAMTGSVLAAGKAINLLRVAMASASAGGASMATVLRAAGVAAGPIAAILGGVALLAIQNFSSATLDAQASVADTRKLFDELGLQSIKTAEQIREQALATNELTESNKKLAESQRERNLTRVARSEDYLRYGDAGSRFVAPFSNNRDLDSAFTIAQRAWLELQKATNDADKAATMALERLSKGLIDASIPANVVIEELRQIQQTNISQNVLDLVDALDEVAISLEQVRQVKIVQLDSSPIEEANEEVINLLEGLSLLAFERRDFEVKKEIDDLTKRLKDGEVASQETLEEIIKLTSHNGDFSTFISNLTNAINKVIQLGSAASNTKLLIDSLSTNSTVPTSGLVGSDAAETRAIQEQITLRNKWIDSQKEFNNLSKQERDIREEIDRLVRNASKEDINFKGDVYTNEQLRALAAQNLAIKESDKDKKTESDKFSDYLKNKLLEVEALEAERVLREGLNPLIQDYGYELERQKFKQDAINEAKKRGQTLDETSLIYIDQLAERFATAQSEMAKLEESQNKLKESLQEWFDLGKSATRSFIDDLIEGKTAAEAFGNALQQLGSKLIDLGLNSIFGTGSGGNAFGLLGQLFGITPRASGGPVTAGQPYVVGEKRPELFVPNQNGVIIPRLPNSGSSSGSVNAPVQISIDARGADSNGMMRVEQQLIKLKAELPYVIRNEVQKRPKKGW